MSENCYHVNTFHMMTQGQQNWAATLETTLVHLQSLSCEVIQGSHFLRCSKIQIVTFDFERRNNESKRQTSSWMKNSGCTENDL